MSGRGRGRPPGPRPPSQKDLETPKIGQFFHQQPFAGEDSEELDSADAGPSGECSTKRGAPVTGSGGGGKRRKG